MRSQLYLKTLTELYATIQTRMTDSSNELAGAPYYYAGINEAIEMWGNRVTVPHLYNLPSGFADCIYAYALPSHIHPPFAVQIYDGVTWFDISGYAVEPQADGTYLLRLPVSPYTQSGRIIYYSQNGPLITTAATLQAAITATSTTIAVTVTGGPPAGRNGYVKIDNEWLAYNGITINSATLYTLNDIDHAQADTLAVSHLVNAPVTWGVAVDDTRLWSQMYDHVTAYIHGVQMHKGTTEDIGRHEKLMSYYQQKADSFWRNQGYVGQRAGQGQITSRGLGPGTW